MHDNANVVRRARRRGQQAQNRACGSEATDRSGKGNPQATQPLDTGDELSRRGFIKATGGSIAAIALAGPAAAAATEEGEEMGQGGIAGFFKSVLGICETSKLDPAFWSQQGSTVRVRVRDVPELQRSGGAVYLDGKGLGNPVLVLRKGEAEYLACSNRCTHMGRKLDPVSGKAVLRCCSVGHSTFDHQGKVLGGSAKGPLTVYPTSLENGELVVTLSKA